MEYTLKYYGENSTIVSENVQYFCNIPQNIMGNFSSQYEIFPKIYEGTFQNCFGKFPIFGKYSPKYMGKSFMIVLENSHFWGNISQNVWEKLHNSFRKFPILRTYYPKYGGKSSTIYRKYSTSILGNFSQYSEKFSQILRNIP